jgi:hypothetical protein
MQPFLSMLALFSSWCCAVNILVDLAFCRAFIRQTRAPNIGASGHMFTRSHTIIHSSEQKDFFFGGEGAAAAGEPDCCAASFRLRSALISRT